MDTLQHLWKGDSHLSDEGIALFADALKFKKLDKLPPAMREHVSGCKLCKTEIMELYVIIEKQKSVDKSHPFFSRSGNTLQMIYRIAATFLLLIGLGVLIYFLDGRGTMKPALTMWPDRDSARQTIESKGQAQVGDSIGPKRSDKNLIAENFQTSPNLEDLVGGAVRSGDITVYSPQDGEISGQKILFRWTGAERGEEMILQILTNKEKVVHRAQIRDSLYVFEKKNLPEGLYYWKLLGKDELVYVGKFLIR